MVRGRSEDSTFWAASLAEILYRLILIGRVSDLPEIWGQIGLSLALLEISDLRFVASFRNYSAWKAHFSQHFALFDPV